MKKRRTRQLYQQDLEQVEKKLWRVASRDRRGFLKKSALVSMAMLLGETKGMIPAGLLDNDQDFVIPGKSGDLILLNDRPINAETPAHLLDPDLTPNDLFFVRNNGIPPLNVDISSWTLEISGESARNPTTFTLQELKDRFPHHTYRLTLECGGNGRSEFNPPAKGNQWSVGAVGCAEWKGVRLRDVLSKVGLQSDAAYIGYYGKDAHLSGDPEKDSISRGVPIDKAMEEESLIAWQMNGEDLPEMNGYPLRLVFGGYPASCSGKWLERLVIRNKVHDGTKMTGSSYRVPCNPVPPGAEVSDEDMCIIEAMPVKSLITFPKSGATIKSSQRLPIRGHAWTSADHIFSVEYSIDFGQSWKKAKINQGVNRYAWQNFSANITFPEEGYYEVWARATDSNGNRQPIILPGWNPKGYLNNACHRIAVKIVNG